MLQKQIEKTKQERRGAGEHGQETDGAFKSTNRIDNTNPTETRRSWEWRRKDPGEASNAGGNKGHSFDPAFVLLPSGQSAEAAGADNSLLASIWKRGTGNWSAFDIRAICR